MFILFEQSPLEFNPGAGLFKDKAALREEERQDAALLKDLFLTVQKKPSKDESGEEDNLQDEGDRIEGDEEMAEEEEESGQKNEESEEDELF